MHLVSLSLRNYRVYRHLDLEFPDGLIGIYGPNGAGKCLPGHIRVYDADAGGMVPISQFVGERRKRTLGLRQGRIRPVEVVDWIELGERPTVELTLGNGARIELAETHPVLTDSGCVPAKDLTSDHWVAEAAVIPQLGPPRLTVDEALLLGLLLGDGSLRHTGVSLTAGDGAVAKLFAELVERIYPDATVGSKARAGTTARTWYVRSALDATARRHRWSGLVRRLHQLGIPLERYVRGGNLASVVRGDRGISWEGLCAIEEEYGLDLFPERSSLYPARSLHEWIRSLGLLGATAGDKFVPNEFFTLPDEQIWALLGGLWLTDGRLIGTRSSPDVALYSKSRRLIFDIALLLKRVGVRSSTKQRLVQGKPYWTVTIAQDALPAIRHLPLVGVKAEKRDDILERPQRKRLGTGDDLIPPSFNDGIKRWTPPSGANRGIKRRHHAMNRATFRGFAGPGSVADDETTWSRVASVAPTGRSVPCYDLEVETDEHLYLAESFIVHNSTLIEAISWAIYGEARTGKDGLRTADTREDLRVTLMFEHEGNTYEVRRALKGQNLTPEVQVFRNAQLAVQSVRDANAFLARVLGMSAPAFLASVCAQQKELTAFSAMAPADRRRLVLDLLGVSPVERALTRSREAARDARKAAQGARQALVPLDGLETAVAGAEAERAAAAGRVERATATEQAAAAALAERKAATAAAEQAAREPAELRAGAGLARAEAAQHREEAGRHERRAAAADALVPKVAEAEAALAGLAAVTERVHDLDAARQAHGERAALAGAVAEAARRRAAAERELATREQAAAGAGELAARLAAAERAVEVAALATQAARDRWTELNAAHAAAEARDVAAQARLAAAREAAETAAELDPAAPCPTCGQALGDAFEQVRGHRVQERVIAAQAAADAATALADAARARDEIRTEGETRRAEERRLVAARDAVAAEHRRAEQATALAADAQARLAAVAEELAARERQLAGVPDPGYHPAAHEAARAELEALREVEKRLAGWRVEQAHADVERANAKAALARADAADARAAELDARAAACAHLEVALADARAAEQAAAAAAVAAHGEAQRAAEALTGADRRLADHRSALDRALAAHERVAELEEQAAALEKTSDLLKGFRLHLVARLGSRLSAEAARLFGELTDNEYADLVVDPEDYGMRIADGGVEHELRRFSGSENDLASLSLRVAISLVVADGARELGLLVLDEVLGSLDRERRERMLAALTTLQGRFRQVLLVTHNDEVKDLLPAAIEVRKGPGRSASVELHG